MTDLTKEEYDTIVNFIKDNNIFIRSGSCNRCGKCCYGFDETHLISEGIKKECSHLSYDGETAICDIYELDRPQICIDNPIYPTNCMVPEAINDCGYSWVVNDTLTKTEATEKFNNICDKCHRKTPCAFYDKVIVEIEEKCK